MDADLDETDAMLYGNTEPIFPTADSQRSLSEKFQRLRQSPPLSIPPLPANPRNTPASDPRPSFEDSLYTSDNPKQRSLSEIIEQISNITKISASDTKDLPPLREGHNTLSFTADDFLPPMDSMMSLRSSRLQRDRFFEEVEIGDVFCCSVLSVTNSSLDMVVLCYACKRNREIDHLKVTAYCSSRDIPELLYGEKKEVADVYSVKDKVTGVVIGVNHYNEKVQMSLLDRDLPRRFEGHINLGLLRSEDLPASYRAMCMSHDLSYGQILATNTLFQSPGVTSRLCKMLGLDDKLGSCSLLHRVNRERIPTEEKALALRQQQSRIHALHNVVTGVALYKEGKQREAMAMYNKALDIDGENVEALVARGAMYANNESYHRALEDFRHALKVNPEHQNALDYTVQTLLVYARDLEDTGDSSLAIKCYREVLSLDSSNKSARESLASLSESRASSADQQPVVSSTRSDSSSPVYAERSRSVADKRRSRESPARGQHFVERSRRDSSLEKRRRSLLADRDISRGRGSEGIYNEERVIVKKEIVRPSSSSSSSSSPSSSSSRSSSPTRRRHSSHSGTSVGSHSNRKHGFHQKSRSKSGLSPSGPSKRRRSHISSKSHSRDRWSKHSRVSPDALSPSESRSSSRRSSKKTAHRQLSDSSSHTLNISRGRDDRSPPTSHTVKTKEESSERGSLSRSSRPTTSDSAEHTRRSSHKEIIGLDGDVRVKVERSLDGAKKQQRKSDDKQKSHKRAVSKEQSRSPKAVDTLTDDKTERLDRYGMVVRDSSKIDLFSDLTDEEPKKKALIEKKLSTTSFLPYCLTTDPIKKSNIKPFTVKKTVSGDKSIANFMVQAQSGKRKAILAPEHVHSKSSSIVGTIPSSSSTHLNKSTDLSKTQTTDDSPSASRRLYSRSRSRSSRSSSLSRSSDRKSRKRSRSMSYRNSKGESFRSTKSKSGRRHSSRSSKRSRSRSNRSSGSWSYRRSRSRSYRRSRSRSYRRSRSRSSSNSRTPGRGSTHKKRHSSSRSKRKSSARAKSNKSKSHKKVQKKASFVASSKKKLLTPQQSKKAIIHEVGMKRNSAIQQAKMHLQQALQEQKTSKVPCKTSQADESGAVSKSKKIAGKKVKKTSVGNDSPKKDDVIKEESKKVENRKQLLEMEDFVATLKKKKKVGETEETNKT